MFGDHYMPPIASTRSESGRRKIRSGFETGYKGAEWSNWIKNKCTKESACAPTCGRMRLKREG